MNLQLRLRRLVFRLYLISYVIGIVTTAQVLLDPWFQLKPILLWTYLMGFATLCLSAFTYEDGKALERITKQASK